MSNFHNPYNFIPTPGRPKHGTPLGDGEPCGQEAYHDDHWTGSIDVEMTVASPLLIPDAASSRVDGSGHTTFGVRRGSDGTTPYVPPTSIKGMLRSAYEAVTNSRMGVFEDHDSRLAYRMATREALRLIPARIMDDHTLQLLVGTTAEFPRRTAAGNWAVPTMYAAWLPMYRTGNPYPWANIEHGTHVYAYVQLCRRTDGPANFLFWTVQALVPIVAGESRPVGPPAAPIRRQDGKAVEVAPDPTATDRWVAAWVEGWVCRTNRNIGTKHDERVFFIDPALDAQRYRYPKSHSGPSICHESHPLRRRWHDVIQSYQSAHTHEEVWKRKDDKGKVVGPEVYLGRDIGDTAWSRHVYLDGKQDRADAKELCPGTLCYVRVPERAAPGNFVVDDLFPVMIARELFPNSPLDLLDDGLRPATKRSDLSPADRVFGWVGKREAIRGNLRVSRVDATGCAVEEGDAEMGPDGVPLAILGEPKPQQFRFYVGDRDGHPVESQCKPADSYTKSTGTRRVRGRKVYPHHHNVGDGYWNRPIDDRTQGAATGKGYFQEYRHPQDRDHHQGSGKERSSQNRSVLSWVSVGSAIRFRLSVTNLSSEEIGGLLWLLSLNDKDDSVSPAFFRFGGGKPLGFGSVGLRIIDQDLRSGSEWRGYYSPLKVAAGGLLTAASSTSQSATADGSLGAGSAATSTCDRLVERFRNAVEEAYDQPFENVSFVAAFLQAARGFDDALPTHYPRSTARPTSEGKNFEWFEWNNGLAAGPQSLGPLVNDPGLRKPSK